MMNPINAINYSEKNIIINFDEIDAKPLEYNTKEYLIFEIQDLYEEGKDQLKIELKVDFTDTPLKINLLFKTLYFNTNLNTGRAYEFFHSTYEISLKWVQNNSVITYFIKTYDDQEVVHESFDSSNIMKIQRIYISLESREYWNNNAQLSANIVNQDTDREYNDNILIEIDSSKVIFATEPKQIESFVSIILGIFIGIVIIIYQIKKKEVKKNE